MTHYSQNDEQEVILKYFGDRVGRFLDIGAYDGFTFSNTAALIERGWGGLMIEPSIGPFAALHARHGENPNLTLIHACIGMDARLVQFFPSSDALSTTKLEQTEKWKHPTSFGAPYFTPQITIEQLLFQFSGPFHFVSIDTEGTSFDLLRRLPLSDLAPECICVEHDDQIIEVTPWVLSHGYSVLGVNQENIIYAK